MTSKQSIQFDTTADKTLFMALKAKRLQIAKTQNIPPYLVFHDKTLVEMAIKKPTHPHQLASINGVGEVKITRYGEAFLAVINADTGLKSRQIIGQ